MFKIPPDRISAWVEANFEYKSRKGGQELVICNPLNGDDGFHFNIGLHGVVHDWRGDQWAGSNKPTFLRFVQLYRKCTFAQAIQEVCGKGTSLRAIELEIRRSRQGVSEFVEEPEEKILELPFGCQKIIGSTHPKMAEMLLRWLDSRGVPKDRVEILNLHHFADTVIWPYYEYDMLVYWQSRNRVNKIFNFPDESVGVGKTNFLYNFDNVEPNDYCIVVEALFGSHTLDAQTVASGGAVLESKQVRKIRVLNPTRGVILGPDNDKAGLASIPSNYELIKPYYPVFFSIPPRIPYVESGETKYSKDWNELYTGPGISLPKIREIFEERVTKCTISEISKILKHVSLLTPEA